MSRFSDYLSSMITPQMTLLEKFNKLLEFLKENNYISVFYSSEDYNPTTRNYQISNVSTLNYNLKLGDCIVFSNGYYAFVETLGENTFTIGNILYFQGEQGVSIVSANISNTGDLILALSNGNTINAGNTGAVKDFIIDNNQHLIVRYLNGTQNDLGSIFQGNVNINGNFTANSIIENMTGYAFRKPVSYNKIEYNTIYAGAVKNGNKLTLVVFGTVKKLQETDGQAGFCAFRVPLSVGNKLFPYTVATDNYVLAQLKFAFNNKEDWSDKEGGAIIEKWNDYGENQSVLDFTIGGMNALTIGIEYYYRMEVTFLLSDNLAQ